MAFGENRKEKKILGYIHKSQKTKIYIPQCKYTLKSDNHFDEAEYS